MPFDYEANVAAVRNALTNYNTTTSNPDLSSGLTTRVRTIRVDDPEVASVRLNELPAVFVRVQSGDEEAAGLGSTGPLASNVQKFKSVRYEVISMYGRDGMHTDSPDHLTESYRLAENVEGVFQAEFRLSNTALWCHPERTDFGSVQFGNVRVKAFVVTLNARYMFR